MKDNKIKNRLREYFPPARLFFLFNVLVSIFVTAVIGFALFAGTHIILTEFVVINNAIYWSSSFAFLALGIVHVILYFQFDKDEKALRIMHLAFGGVYIIISILLFIFGKTYLQIYTIICFLYVATHIAQVTVGLVYKHKTRDIVLAALLYLFLSVELLVFISLYDEMPLLSATMTFFIVGIYGLGVIFKEAFARLHLKKLIKIIRKTYALEIILGLLSLIFSTSFAFYVTDDLSYGDALWYSFAIVTTIGFGDIAVKSLIGRILSVILGIYGLVVVAVITSIIVNFYNETKNLSDDEGDLINEKIEEIETKEKEIEEEIVEQKESIEESKEEIKKDE